VTRPFISNDIKYHKVENRSADYRSKAALVRGGEYIFMSSSDWQTVHKGGNIKAWLIELGVGSSPKQKQTL
jgi:hypothetical protein